MNIVTHPAGVLATTVVLGATAASAQELPSIVALATPAVDCHVAPSHSARAAKVLEVTGDGWVVDMRVQRTTTDERGDTWVHIPARHTGSPRVAEGCWVPEPTVVSTEGAGHLLALADRLVSADPLPPFEHLLAVHTLFVHPRYRDQVEGSADLGQRRAAVTAKAVEAVQVTGLEGVRPVDRDPRIMTWIESLGDGVRYQESVSGRGTWTFNDDAAQADVGLAEPERVTPAPEGRELAVIAPDVACRVRPSRTASGSRALRMDLHFRTDRADTSVAGEAWVFYPPGSCWVAAAHTLPGESEAHVQAIADRFLTSGEGWSTYNYLVLYTVLSSRHRGHRDVVEASARLGLRRLEVLRRVLGAFLPWNADAVTLAWIESLGLEVATAAEGHAWTVSDDAYLTLYEKHRSDPFAEDIMWKYASESDAYSCEGEFACQVEQFVNRRLARYWTDFPGGRHLAEAVELGRLQLGNGLEECSAAREAGPDSREARNWGWSGWERRGPDISQELLASLEGVNEEARRPLTEVLAQLETCAAALGSPPVAAPAVRTDIGPATTGP